jgi:RNA polymerase sigma-70 factor (ECF subfamily)
MSEPLQALGSSLAREWDTRDAVAGPLAPPPLSTVRLSRARAPRRHDAHSAQVEDADLVCAVLAGDRGAEATIWRRYVPLVRGKLRRSVGGPDVEDHVQEVFLRLFEHLAELRDPAALRSFLIGITLRIAGTELRRRRCRWWLTLSATGDLPEPHVFEDPGETRVAVARFAGMLRTLSPQSYRFFELRFIEDRELADVASAMNVSLATAKRHLARVAARVHAMADRELNGAL